MTLFEKIIQREIPADIVHEDQDCIAFKDIAPQAPTHILVVPKKPIPSIADITPEDTPLMGHLVATCSTIAEKLGIAEGGYRVVVNTRDDGGQTVPHIHFHLLAGRKMTWPPG